MFLTITDASVVPSDIDADSVCTLSKGDYACRRISTHMSDFNSVKEEMKEVLKDEDFCIIETDTLSEQNKKDGYPFELEYNISH